MSMNRWAMSLVIMGLVGMGSATLAAAEQGQRGKETAKVKITPQTTCPVMTGVAINKKFYIDHEGQRVYFCCPTCVKKFKADPKQYLKKMAAEGVALEKAPPPTPAKPTAKAQAEHPQ